MPGCRLVGAIIATMDFLQLDQVNEAIRQGGHHIPEDVIRRRFIAGLYNFEHAYKGAADDWAEFDNVGEEPILLQWSENT